MEGQLRELRLATAALKAEISVLRHELEQAMALAAERRAETVRMAALLPLVHRSFAAARSAAISLDYSPEVAQLDAVNGKTVLDLEANRANVSEIVLPVHPAAAAQRLDLAATGDQRRTA